MRLASRHAAMAQTAHETLHLDLATRETKHRKPRPRIHSLCQRGPVTGVPACSFFGFPGLPVILSGPQPRTLSRSSSKLPKPQSHSQPALNLQSLNISGHFSVKSVLLSSLRCFPQLPFRAKGAEAHTLSLYDARSSFPLAYGTS